LNNNYFPQLKSNTILIYYKVTQRLWSLMLYTILFDQTTSTVPCTMTIHSGTTKMHDPYRM